MTRLPATVTRCYWTQFAHTGDPNGAGRVVWPVYDAKVDAYLELQTAIAAHTGLHTQACDVLDAVAASDQSLDED